MRSLHGRRLAVGTALVLAVSTGAGVSSAAEPGSDEVAADPCALPSGDAEPAACASGSATARRAGVVARVPVVAGNAFADGLAGTGELDKITFPPGDMTAPQQVADEAAGINIFGYDFSVDGSVLYGVDNVASTLVTIDQSTGLATVVGPMVKTDVAHNWSDVVVDPVTGAAYAGSVSATEYSLYSLNLSTGATTPINTVPTTVLVIDLAMNCAGQMFALAVGDDSLYSVNPSTGALTLIGPTGVSINFQQGMDFDNATGVLHAWLYLGGGANQYSSLDLTTGAATGFAGTEPTGEFEGAIRTGCAPPAMGVTGGPSGKTALLRPAFGFSSGNATIVECSIDRGTPDFTVCPGTTYQSPADLSPGPWTFRVRGTRGLLTAQATRTFTVVDCAALEAAVAKATKKVKKAKKKLKAAKASGDQQKITKAKKKLKQAKQKLKKARAALAAEPVCP